MANIKQQKKRIGIAQRQRLENLRYKSTVKTLFRTLQTHVDTGDSESAGKAHSELVSLLDRAASRKSMHKNTASRKKARAARMLLQEPKKDTASTRRTKKKPAVRKPKADAAATKAAKQSTTASDEAAPPTDATVAEAPVAASEDPEVTDTAPVDQTDETDVPDKS